MRICIEFIKEIRLSSNQKILDLKGKVVDADLNKVCEKIERLKKVWTKLWQRIRNSKVIQ